MGARPSTQEIADYLAGLNRVSQAAVITYDTARAKHKGIDNYLHWFKSYGIKIHQDPKSQTWKLGVAPSNHQA
jgi:hypothetical protein